jgi:hypothetical protein
MGLFIGVLIRLVFGGFFDGAVAPLLSAVSLGGHRPRILLRLLAAALDRLARAAEALSFDLPPGVFAWEDASHGPPAVREQVGAPLRIVDARFRFLMSFGSPAGAVLSVRVRNVSLKPIRSFCIGCHQTDVPIDGTHLRELDAGLWPGQARTFKLESRGCDRLTLWVACVRFTDGSSWHEETPEEARR